MPLLNVQSGADITSDIHAALDAGWTDIEIPAGTFIARQAVIDEHGVTLRGQGPDTILQRGSLVRALWVTEGIEEFTIRDLHLDMVASTDFRVGIECSGAINTTIRDCHLYTEVIPEDANSTNMALFARGSRGLRVFDCTTDKVQLKINGSSRDAEIRDCTFVDSHNFGLSCVTREPEQLIEDIRILRCTAIRGWSGGIYVGVDGDFFRGRHRRIVIKDCVATLGREHPHQTIGILFRSGDLSEDVYIVGNDVSIDPQGANTALFGIFLKAMGEPGQLRGGTVAGNTAHVPGGLGIYAQQYDAAALQIIDNTVSSLRLRSHEDVTAHLESNVVTETLRRETLSGAQLRVSYGPENDFANETDSHQGTYTVVPVPVPVAAGQPQPSAHEQAQVSASASAPIVSPPAVTASPDAQHGTAEITGGGGGAEI